MKSIEHYKLLDTMVKAGIRVNFKLKPNGTIMYSHWKGTEMPNFDRCVALGNDFNMFFASDKGFGCTLIHPTNDINEAQKLLKEDFDNNEVIFDSSEDGINSVLPCVTIYVSDAIKSSNVIAQFVSRVTKKFMDYHHENKNKDGYDLQMYNIWDTLGGTTKVLLRSIDDLDKLKDDPNVLTIKETKRSSSIYDRVLCALHVPDFLSNMPLMDVEDLVIFN